jgi:hypothetical protein
MNLARDPDGAQLASGYVCLEGASTPLLVRLVAPARAFKTLPLDLKNKKNGF